jgi:vacuolar-type H+-ATPase subunit H
MVGENYPPSQIEFTAETSQALGDWLKDNPVVQTEEQARAGKLLVDRARLCVQDLEAERDGKVRPLNVQVKTINDSYRSPRDTLEKITQELLLRLDAYVKAEEAKRQAIAEAARKAAEEAECIAREAEHLEREAIEDARAGVESDIVSTTVAADAAYEEYQRLQRSADRAGRDTNVRIGGGFSRSLGARARETLSVTDPLKALSEIGWTEKILDALVTEAREFRRQHDRLPQGVESVKQRRL